MSTPKRMHTIGAIDDPCRQGSRHRLDRYVHPVLQHGGDERPRVYVHLDHGRSLERWAARHARGEVWESSPYSYADAADQVALQFSVDRRDGRVGRFLRKGSTRILGFDLFHALGNRAGLRRADVVWTHTEREHLAVLTVVRTLQRGVTAARRRPNDLALGRVGHSVATTPLALPPAARRCRRPHDAESGKRGAGQAGPASSHGNPCPVWHAASSPVAACDDRRQAERTGRRPGQRPAPGLAHASRHGASRSDDRGAHPRPSEGRRRRHRLAERNGHTVHRPCQHSRRVRVGGRRGRPVAAKRPRIRDHRRARGAQCRPTTRDHRSRWRRAVLRRHRVVSAAGRCPGPRGGDPCCGDGRARARNGRAWPANGRRTAA